MLAPDEPGHRFASNKKELPSAELQNGGVPGFFIQRGRPRPVGTRNDRINVSSFRDTLLKLKQGAAEGFRTRPDQL
jgi:hypothetical protein